jgi:hypothetical protein
VTEPRARTRPADPYAPMTPGWANRTPVLVVLILGLQVAFVWSYVAALHEPTPHHVPLGIVAPAAVTTQLQEQVATQTDAVILVPLESADEARRLVQQGTLGGAVVIGGTSANLDTLIVTQVPSIAYESLYREVLDGVDRALAATDAASARGYAVERLNSFDSGDPKGLTPFYLAIGWVVGGYLLIAFFGFTQRHVHTWAGLVRRLALLLGYSVASGVLGALVVGPLLGAFDGHVLALAAFGTALSFAVCVCVQAVETLLGPIYGTGVAIVAFVVIGNPAAGGPFPRSFMPAFWQHVGAWLPPGMGTDGIRSVVYGTDGMGPVAARVAAYIVIGLLVCGAGTALLVARDHRDDGEEATTAAPA